MKKISTIFLQVVIVLIGIGALALMLWEPHIEGGNVRATLFEIYFKDPFLAYAYTASTSAALPRRECPVTRMRFLSTSASVTK